MKYQELKTIALAEVKRTLAELQQQEHDLSVKIRLKQLKNTHKAKQVRKDIARILTFLRQQALSNKQ
jgi:large subunit ribosomal protein L29